MRTSAIQRESTTEGFAGAWPGRWVALTSIRFSPQRCRVSSRSFHKKLVLSGVYWPVYSERKTSLQDSSGA